MFDFIFPLSLLCWFRRRPTRRCAECTGDDSKSSWWKIRILYCLGCFNFQNDDISSNVCRLVRWKKSLYKTTLRLFREKLRKNRVCATFPRVVCALVYKYLFIFFPLLFVSLQPPPSLHIHRHFFIYAHTYETYKTLTGHTLSLFLPSSFSKLYTVEKEEGNFSSDESI